ncbi:histidine utilization repressor [Chelatococcus daeguensis]|uniref:histidine utilization repressor n=1 Tax=Chelatococcus daeguensis TaxID=444444 RepID=UPI0007AB3360|nr:histidine utilization repressor [Chelatococcus daeguensis]KZE36693.1 histidine utilization repressor [Chelatococcus daeguensis]MBM3082324.1 histidine utilization repressor [Chelatococcus daeguensis]
MVSIAEPLPRYAEIRRALEEKILSGEWPPGHRVPSEHDLVAQFGCSRMTVNKAISALAAAGLVVRRRRSGSFVAAPKSQETVLEVHDIKAEITGSGRSYRYVILDRERRRARPEDLARLGAAKGSFDVEALTVLHFADERPFVHERRLINLAVVPAAAREAFAASPPGTWLLEQIPWTEAEHIIRAENAGADVAHHLAIARGAACLVVVRRTFQAGATITAVTLTYPGERHQLVARFSPATR